MEACRRLCTYEKAPAGLVCSAAVGERASPGQPQPSLIGRWRSVETSKGGIGAVYHFHADGTVDFSPGAIVDMPYRVEGDQVIFPPELPMDPRSSLR